MNERADPPGTANLPIGLRHPGTANLPIGPVRPAGSAVDSPVWRSRGYLPHFEGADAIQHVNFHLADSLPKEVLDRLHEETSQLPVERQDVERRKKVEAWIDAGQGSCLLREPDVASMVQKALLFFDAQRYHLFAWVVMPNHVHVLFQPLPGWTVAKIVASWKKFTARKMSDCRSAGNVNLSIGSSERANQEIGGPGEPERRVWSREYWDRYIRDDRHLRQVIQYIHENPVKIGLAAKPEDWRWSSAFAEHANQEIGGPASKP